MISDVIGTIGNEIEGSLNIIRGYATRVTFVAYIPRPPPCREEKAMVKPRLSSPEISHCFKILRSYSHVDLNPLANTVSFPGAN